MKKMIGVIILLHFLFLFCCQDDEIEETPAEVFYLPASFNYWVFAEPGIMMNSKQIKKEMERRLDFLQNETGFELKVYAQEYHPSGTRNEAPEIFLQKINSVSPVNAPDIIFTDNLRVNSVLNTHYTAEVNDLIPDHAPIIYHSFPAHFWKYRKEAGRSRDIPVHSYALRNKYGIWIIKKDFIDRTSIDVIDSDSLLNLLSFCGDTDELDDQILYQDGQDLYITISENLIKQYEHLLLLFGIELVGNREIYFDHNNKTFHRIDELRKRDGLSLLPTIRYLSVVPQIEYVSRIPWSVLFIAYGSGFDVIEPSKVNYLKQIFNEEKYQIIEDFELINHFPADSINSYYISTKSTDIPKKLKIFDSIINNAQVTENLLYMDKTISKENQEAVLQNINYKIENSKYRYGEIKPLSTLCNKKYLRISNFLPERVRENYQRFLEQSEVSSLSGFDVEKEYHDILMELGLSGPSDTEYIRISEDDIRNILSTDSPDIEQLLSNTDIIDEIILKLQKQMDLYLKLSLSEQ